MVAYGPHEPYHAAVSHGQTPFPHSELWLMESFIIVSDPDATEAQELATSADYCNKNPLILRLLHTSQAFLDFHTKRYATTGSYTAIQKLNNSAVHGTFDLST